MTLREAQHAFCQALAGFIVHACAQGYAFTFGEAHRPPEVAALYAEQGRGIAASLHTERLAVDLNVFYQGRYLRGGPDLDAEEAEAWERLGRWWEAAHPSAAWGGRFRRKDFNHFSFRWGGRA